MGNSKANIKYVKNFNIRNNIQCLLVTQKKTFLVNGNANNGYFDGNSKNKLSF